VKEVGIIQEICWVVGGKDMGNSQWFHLVALLQTKETILTGMVARSSY
jgi:hypothetical protein